MRVPVLRCIWKSVCLLVCFPWKGRGALSPSHLLNITCMCVEHSGSCDKVCCCNEPQCVSECKPPTLTWLCGVIYPASGIYMNDSLPAALKAEGQCLKIGDPNSAWVMRCSEYHLRNRATGIPLWDIWDISHSTNPCLKYELFCCKSISLYIFNTSYWDQPSEGGLARL